MEIRIKPKKKPSFHRPPTGSKPGTLLTGEGAQPTKVHLTAYSKDKIEQFVDIPLSKLEDFADAGCTVLWLEVVGLGSPKILKKLAHHFNIHPLALEDIVSNHQRPKVETFSGHLLIFLNSLRREVAWEKNQVSIFLSEKVVISFVEASVGRDSKTGAPVTKAHVNFAPVKERLLESSSKMRGFSPDYLAYALIDTIIDDYFPVADAHSQALDELEEKILHGSMERTIVGEIHSIKLRIAALHQLVWNHKEMLTFLTREELQLLTPTSRLYLRDCYDHTLQIIDYLSRLRDSSLTLMDIFFSLETSRTNDIMKVLTIMSSVFLPLTFLSGLYGMNFNRNSPWNMPELDWTYGYPFALSLMAAAVVILLIYFYKQGWIKNPWSR